MFARRAIRGARYLSSSASELSFDNIGVIGAGIMGHGIAQVTAMSGKSVTLVDVDSGALEKGVSHIRSSLTKQVEKQVAKRGEGDVGALVEDVMGRVSTSTDLGAFAECDLVIEAATENLDLKRRIFGDLSGVARGECVFASNTSSLPIASMAEVTDRPSRFLGVHFFSPVQVMRLVEIVRTADTEDAVFEAGMRFGEEVGKTSVACKDTPGFIVNRLLVPFLAQAVAMVERGDASVSDVDIAMKLGTGHPMGPLTLADYVGLDTTLFILEGWVKDHPNEPAFFVPPLLKQLVQQGHLGRKSGRGFYHWEGATPKGVAV